MKFSASGGWFRKDWYGTVRESAVYGFRGVEQLGWLGVDFDLAKNVLDETGITSTAIIIESETEENNRLMAWNHGMVWEDSRRAFADSFRETVRAAKANGSDCVSAWQHEHACAFFQFYISIQSAPTRPGK